MEERLLPPRQAVVAFFARVPLAHPRTEWVAFDDALGRVLAEPIVADRRSIRPRSAR